jgi:hypothetical protein
MAKLMAMTIAVKAIATAKIVLNAASLAKYATTRETP